MLSYMAGLLKLFARDICFASRGFDIRAKNDEHGRMSFAK